MSKEEHPSNTYNWGEFIYFAADGSFGDAGDLLLVHVSAIKPDDWQSIWDASDSERAEVAADLAKANDSQYVQLRSRK